MCDAAHRPHVLWRAHTCVLLYTLLGLETIQPWLLLNTHAPHLLRLSPCMQFLHSAYLGNFPNACCSMHSTCRGGCLGSNFPHTHTLHCIGRLHPMHIAMHTACVGGYVSMQVATCTSLAFRSVLSQVALGSDICVGCWSSVQEKATIGLALHLAMSACLRC